MGGKMAVQLLKRQGAARMGQHGLHGQIIKAQNPASQIKAGGRDPDHRETAEIERACTLAAERPALQRQIN